MKKLFLLLLSPLMTYNLISQPLADDDNTKVNRLLSAENNSLCSYTKTLYYNSNSYSYSLNIREIIDSNKTDNIAKSTPITKKAYAAISYAPLFGFWIGFWSIGVNLSVAGRIFESSTTIAKVFESDSKPNAFAAYTLIGPRYLFPSQSNAHFFIHGLIGVGYHKESRKGDNIWVSYSESHFGFYASPGFGVSFKNPSKTGFRIGLDLIIAPGFPTDIWATSTAGAFQLSIGIIF